MFNDFLNKEFRDAFLGENIRTRLAFQIRALREKYKWSQPQLAERAGKTQSVISRLEDPRYGKFTIKSLLDLASAFDVALLISFVPYTKLITEISDVSPKALAIASYEEEKEAMEEIAAIAANAALSSQQELKRNAYNAAQYQVITMTGASTVQTLGRNLSTHIRGLQSAQQSFMEIRP